MALLILAGGARAQISTHIAGYSEMVPEGGRVDRPRPFVGVFDFVKLPAPLQEAEVNFALTAQLASEEDWEVSVWALGAENRVDIVGDSVHVWKAPIEVGDQFKGTIKFIPLASGSTGMDVGALKFGGIEVGLTFSWCLSEDGELLSLGNSETDPKLINDCKAFTTYYFPTDSVYLTKAPYEQRLRMFGHEIVVKPVPKVGDTSFVAFKLTANRDLPDGLDFGVSSVGMDVVSVPGSLSDPILVGQQLTLTVGVVPRPINAREYLYLQVFEDLAQRGKGDSQKFRVDFIFDNQGNLKYTTPYWFKSDACKRAPDAFRKADDGISGRITVWKSGAVERHGDVIRCGEPGE